MDRNIWQQWCSIYNSMSVIPTKPTITNFGSWQRIRATDHLIRGNLTRSLKPPLRLPPSHVYNADLAWPPSPCQWIRLRTIDILSNWLSCIFLLSILTITGWPTAQLTISLSVKEQSLIGNQAISNWCNVSLPFITNNKLDHFPMIIIIPTIHYWVITIAVCIWHTFHTNIIMMVKYHKLSWPDNILYWNEFLDHFRWSLLSDHHFRWALPSYIIIRWSLPSYHHSDDLSIVSSPLDDLFTTTR